MDIEKVFEDLPEGYCFDKDKEELLNKLMDIKNPMELPDEITDEQLEELENEMDRIETVMPSINKFKELTRKAKAIETTKPVFI
jgi:cob(I)alamin adenosyltransferase